MRNDRRDWIFERASHANVDRITNSHQLDGGHFSDTSFDLVHRSSIGVRDVAGSKLTLTEADAFTLLPNPSAELRTVHVC